MSNFFERWWLQFIAEARARAQLDKNIRVIDPPERPEHKIDAAIREMMQK